MILEELFGGCMFLISSLIIQIPPISRGNLPRESTSTFEENPERVEAYDNLIHCEYDEEQHPGLLSHEDVISDEQPRQNYCESFLRSCKVNIGLIVAAVFILGLLMIGLVILDLNTSDACVEWMLNNRKVQSYVHNLRIVGVCAKLLPLFSWFPTCIAMLLGFKQFENNYLLCLFVCAFVIGCTTCVYQIIMSDTYFGTSVSYTLYRIPGHFLFLFSILCGAYLVARKYKQVNQETTYSVFHIFCMFSFLFICPSLLSYIYTYTIVKFFKEEVGTIEKAVIAALTPGIVFPFTATAKYLVLRKFPEMIAPDRAFVLCYFLRGGSIVLYRTMQSGFQDIRLFIGLSLLHGFSNVLSKATLNFRIRIWKCFIKCYNRVCCGPGLKLRPLNSPRIRRLNADLEIQNILFEYTAVILSQGYLTCYLVMSFDVSPWQVVKASLVRIAISSTIDFLFNIISVFIQIHLYGIPMQKVWSKYCQRHIAANAFMIIIFVSYFGNVLVTVYVNNNYEFKEGNKLLNCTTIF